MKKRFHRQLGERRYKKLFVIATEGAKTEPDYFKLLRHPNVVIKVLPSRAGLHNSPAHVLKRMEQHLGEYPLRNEDEAWLVVDKDQWLDEQLSSLYRWSQKNPRFGFALSAPKFELWLLKHFEEANGVVTSQDCSSRLRHHFPEYDKGISARKFSIDSMRLAIKRAKKRDNPPCKQWPRATGTTVYRLVENILRAHQD